MLLVLHMIIIIMHHSLELHIIVLLVHARCSDVWEHVEVRMMSGYRVGVKYGWDWSDIQCFTSLRAFLFLSLLLVSSQYFRLISGLCIT